MNMKICFAALALIPTIAWSAEYLEQVESDVQEANGTTQEITARAKTCIAQNVKNTEVRFGNSSSGGGALGFMVQGRDADRAAGGDVITSIDMEQGIITANGHVDYKGPMGVEFNVKSALTFMAKDGKFKIRHTNIEYLQKSSGSMHNDGYDKVFKVWGTGWKKAEDALSPVSEKISQCVKADPAKEKW